MTKERITTKMLSEKVEKLQQDLTQAKKLLSELQKEVGTNRVSISRFKVYIDEKIPVIDIEAEVKKLMSNKEAILIGMKEEIAPMTNRMRAATVYREYKKKQSG
jgi:hypothetical protein